MSKSIANQQKNNNNQIPPIQKTNSKEKKNKKLQEYQHQMYLIIIILLQPTMVIAIATIAIVIKKKIHQKIPESPTPITIITIDPIQKIFNYPKTNKTNTMSNIKIVKIMTSTLTSNNHTNLVNKWFMILWFEIEVVASINLLRGITMVKFNMKISNRINTSREILENWGIMVLMVSIPLRQISKIILMRRKFNSISLYIRYDIFGIVIFNLVIHFSLFIYSIAHYHFII
jgi:hypothetical protein